MDDEEIIQRLRAQRLETLALADQVAEDRWREPILPGGRTIHDQLAHVLAWDEWAVAVFEISTLRALPPALVSAVADVDAYNARTEERYRRLTRDDILSALQGAVDRVISSAARTGGEQPWARRRIADLASARASDERQGASTPEARGPSVRGLLTRLMEHEHLHATEISTAFGIEPHIERFRDQSQES